MSRKFHPHKPKKCPKSRKTMFRKEADASYAMMRTWAHDSSMDIYSYHTYLCPACSHWHFGNKKMYEAQLKKTEVQIVDTVSVGVD